MQHLPNMITVFRLACVPVFAIAAFQENFITAFYLMVVISVSDALDGLIAKHFGWQSKLGSYLDPLADKVLLVSALLILGYMSLLPKWLVVAAVSRDIMVVVGIAMMYRHDNSRSLCPHWTGKLSTVMQYLLTLAVLIAQFQAVPGVLLRIMIAATMVVLAVNVVVYAKVGWNQWSSARAHIAHRSGRQYNL